MAEASLLERLRACELLSADQLAELERLPEASNPDPKVLARVVVQRGWLTRFQIGQVATGKGKDLFVGPYVMLDRLGEGGMGQVLKARHRHMKRVVALKLIRKEKLGGADSVARFYQEVEAAAQLHHPNIVLAFDAGQAGGTHFFAMEYVEGPDLTRLVREKGTLPVAQACEFIRQAAVGLQHAHERGLVHRDIKPSNLLVTASATDPVVKILDLGLARLGDTFAKDRNLTKMGQVIGTPDYLAPEQALDAHNVDIRADIYSLGCSLYFLLAARAPFQAESLTELLMKHQMNDPDPIRSLRPDVPLALEALLRRMMAKKAQDRPATPAEVAAALEPFARGGQGSRADAPPPVSIAMPASPRSEETWAGLSNDAEVVARPKARASRSRDTIDEEPRGRRKKEKIDKKLLIGGGGGAGVLLLLLVIGGVFLFSSKKPVKVAEKQPATQGPPVQGVPPPEVVVPPVDPKEKPVGKPAGDGVLLAAIERGVREGKTARTQEAGGRWGKVEHTDVPGEGAFLTGLEVGTGKFGTQDVVHYLRPVYQSRRGRFLGPTFGAKQEQMRTLEAKPGYAIGGISINAGAGLDGLSVQFMAIKSEGLDPNESYPSPWIGGKGGNPQTLGGDGTPIVGLFGKLSTQQPPVANGLGLVMLSKAAPPVVSPAGAGDTQLVGGGFGGEVYRDVAAPGWLLAGFEVGLGKFGDIDVIHSLCPIFRSGDREVFGVQRGTDLSRVTTLLAPRGFAVGAINVKAGDNADGLSLTYMRINGAVLDPTVFKESDWIGDPRPGGKILLTGGGKPIFGVAIKATDKDATGLGLVLRGRVVPATTAVLPGEVGKFLVEGGEQVRGVFFPPDGKKGFAFFGPVATALDPATGKRGEAYRLDGHFLGMGASKTGKRLLLADARRVRLLKSETGEELQSLQSTETIPGSWWSVFSPDGKYALSAPNHPSLLLWDLGTGKLEHKFADLGGSVRSCAVTDDGQYVVASNQSNGVLQVWDSKTKNLVHSIAKPAPRMGSGILVAAAGGSSILVSGEDGNLAIFDCATKKEVRKFGPPSSRYRSAMLVTADRKTAVTIGGYDGTIAQEKFRSDVAMQVWDITKGRLVAAMDLPTMPRFLAVSPDGKSALVAEEKTVRYFDLTKLGRGEGAKAAETPRDALGVEVRRFPGSNNALGSSVSFLPDGKTGLAFAGPATYTLDPATGKRTEAFRVGGSPLLPQATSNDRKHILRSDMDGRLRLIHVETGKVVKSAGDTKYHTWAQGVALSQDLKLALSCPDGRLFEKDQPVRGPDGNAASVAACDVCLWDLDTGKLEYRFAGSDLPSQACAFTDDGLYVAAGNSKIPLRVWELKTKKLVHTVSELGAGLGSRANLLVPVGGSEMLVGCQDGSLILYDCATGKEIRQFENAPKHGHNAIAMTADNKTALTIGGGYDIVDGKLVVKDTMMRVWDAVKGVEVARVLLPTMPRHVAVSPDGRFALVSEVKATHYLDLTKLGRGDGTKPAEVDLSLPFSEPPVVTDPLAAPPKPDAISFVGHTGPVNCVCLSPDSKLLVSGGEDGGVRLWEATTGRLVRLVHESKGKSPIRAVRFTHDGAGVLALDEARDLYNGETKTGRGISSSNIGFALPAAPATGFDVSANDGLVAAVMGRSFVPMPIKGPQVRGLTIVLPASGVCVVSIGERNLFALGDETGAVRLADMSPSKSPIFQALTPHKQAVLALAYNAKTKHLYSGSADKTIKMTSLKRNTKPIPRPVGRHEGEVTCLAISPDGKRLASGSKDKTVRVWDLATQKELHKFTDDDEVRGVAFAADGKSVYSAGKTLRVWPLAGAKKEE